MAVTILLLVAVACSPSRAIERNRADLASPDPRVRVLAAKRLAAAGPPARAAERALREGLADAHPEVRRWFAHALGEATTGGAATVEALAGQLRADTYAGARHAAAAALGRIAERHGEPVLDASDALLTAMSDESSPVRDVAHLALRKLAFAEPARGVPILVRLLSHDNVDVRRRTVRALIRLGPDASASVLTTLERVAETDPDESVRTAAGALVERIREE